MLRQMKNTKKADAVKNDLNRFRELYELNKTSARLKRFILSKQQAEALFEKGDEPMRFKGLPCILEVDAHG